MHSDVNVLAQYANFFRVGHTDSEFIVEFCQSYKEDLAEPKGNRIVARIIVTPEGARELHELLGGSLEQHGHLVDKRG